VRIHALQTGTVHVKEVFLHGRPTVADRLRLLLPGPFAPPLPILAWLVEHDGRRILVDAGDTTAAHALPFARVDVRREEELPAALAVLGLAPADVDEVILTHLHGDHMNGAVHLAIPVQVGEDEWRAATGRFGRIAQRITRAPVPPSVLFRPVALDDGPFGAFAASRRLTADGRLVAVATPGHTAGHLSVVAVDDEGRHVLLAGDTTDTLEQLRARRPDVIAAQPKAQEDTIDRVLAHAREHPTVYLPAHDPESVARLAARPTL
jgi:N-acyl homoserine lactone hydrolase